MPRDLTPEHVLDQLKKGNLSPFYLFYGPSEFHMEKVLNRIRETFIPEQARDFNLQIYYGGDADPAQIIDSARSLPFLSQNRLIIVRRVQRFSATALQTFIPYLDNPVESTCLIFVSPSPDFKRKFCRRIRELGQAVLFRRLNEREVLRWIVKAAKDLGLNMDGQACAYLQQVVGNQLRDLHAELEKLYVRYGDTPVGTPEVQELAIYSRIYTIFELMDEISFKRRPESLSVLRRFLEEEDRDGMLKALGMLNRQIRLLWQAKRVLEGGGKTADVAKRIRLPSFLAGKVAKQSRLWKTQELERAVFLLYEADGRLKSGSNGGLVMENLVLSLCS